MSTLKRKWTLLDDFPKRNILKYVEDNSRATQKKTFSVILMCSQQMTIKC